MLKLLTQSVGTLVIHALLQSVMRVLGFGLRHLTDGNVPIPYLLMAMCTSLAYSILYIHNYSSSVHTRYVHISPISS